MTTSAQKAAAWREAARMVLRACELPTNERAAYEIARDPVRVHIMCHVLKSLNRRAQIIERNARKRADSHV